MPYEVVRAVVARRTHTIFDGSAIADLPVGDVNALIDAAVQEYGEDEPRRVVTEQAAVDVVSGEFALTGWSQRTDRVLEIEAPRDLMPKETLNEHEDYRVVEKTTGVYAIRFFHGLATTWRLNTERGWTIATVEADAVAVERVGLLASAKAARTKAARYADTDDPTFAADVVDYKDKASKWVDLAETLEEEYKNAVNRPVETKAAGQQIHALDLDLGPHGSRYRNYLVHRRRRR